VLAREQAATIHDLRIEWATDKAKHANRMHQIKQEWDSLYSNLEKPMVKGEINLDQSHSKSKDVVIDLDYYGRRPRNEEILTPPTVDEPKKDTAERFPHDLLQLGKFYFAPEVNFDWNLRCRRITNQETIGPIRDMAKFLGKWWRNIAIKSGHLHGCVLWNVESSNRWLSLEAVIGESLKCCRQNANQDEIELVLLHKFRSHTNDRIVEYCLMCEKLTAVRNFEMKRERLRGRRTQDISKKQFVKEICLFKSLFLNNSRITERKFESFTLNQKVEVFVVPDIDYENAESLCLEAINGMEKFECRLIAIRESMLLKMAEFSSFNDSWKRKFSWEFPTKRLSLMDEPNRISSMNFCGAVYLREGKIVLEIAEAVI
jgi:hypothetical protein